MSRESSSTSSYVSFAWPEPCAPSVDPSSEAESSSSSTLSTGGRVDSSTAVSEGSSGVGAASAPNADKFRALTSSSFSSAKTVSKPWGSLSAFSTALDSPPSAWLCCAVAVSSHVDRSHHYKGQ